MVVRVIGIVVIEVLRNAPIRHRSRVQLPIPVVRILHDRRVWPDTGIGDAYHIADLIIVICGDIAFRIGDGSDLEYVIGVIGKGRGQNIGITGVVGVRCACFAKDGRDVAQRIVLGVHAVSCRPCCAHDIGMVIEGMGHGKGIGISVVIGRKNCVTDHLALLVQFCSPDAPFPVNHRDFLSVIMIEKGKDTVTVGL